MHTGKGKRGKCSGRGCNDWLLIKKRDEPAEQFLATGKPLSAASVLSGLTIDELDAARAAPPSGPRRRSPTRRCPKRAIAPARSSRCCVRPPTRAFSSNDWIFELKYDGFRMMAHGGAGQAKLRYRSGLDPTDRYPEITSAVRALPIPDLVLDGEIVMLDAEGKPDFHKLSFRGQMHRASRDPARRARRRR